MNELTFIILLTIYTAVALLILYALFDTDHKGFLILFAALWPIWMLARISNKPKG